MDMLNTQGLDPELLRAFVLIAEGNSFTQAADRLGRTQSAISMQIKRLEELLGQTVLSRGKGGAITLTTHGRYLLARARQILALNDEVMATFRAPAMSGTVRLGTPDDYALSHIPGVLRRFAEETHPAVQGGCAVLVIVGPGGEAEGGGVGSDPGVRRQPAAQLAGGAALARAVELDHLDGICAAPAGSFAAGAGA